MQEITIRIVIRNMKRKLFIALMLLSCSTFVSSQSMSPRKLADKVATAYFLDLSTLDGKGWTNGRIKVVVENSLSERTRSHYFGSFRAMERWLKRTQRPDGTPFRESRDVGRCSNVTCTFDFDGGILHNHLYLQRITFGYRNGRRYIKELRLLDGA